MLTKVSNCPLLVALILSSVSLAAAQDDKKVLAEVTVKAQDSVYTKLRGLSALNDAFSGDYATVSNVVLKQDLGTFVFKSGEIYFLKPADGRVTGAVFIGSGEFSLTPPTRTEQNAIAIFVGGPAIKEGFTSLEMFFTDKTFDNIKAMPGVTMGKGGGQAEKARSLYRARETVLRQQLHSNIDSRVLGDLYAPTRPGFFTAFIDGEHFNKLVYNVDPLGIPEVYPEQVALISYGDTDGGIWTAFHLADEYKKGTAVSWTDRRSFDIKHHDIDATINGTKISATDTVTIEMREANSRVLPLALFGSLRVQSVIDADTGSAVNFIQEKKDEDSDLGVILPEAKAVGKPFKIKVTYEGSDAIRAAGTGNFILIPRETWYPNNPASAFGDRATFDIAFHYKKQYMMVGVGDRVGEETVDGDIKTSKWTSGDVELAVAGFNFGDFKMKDLKDPDTGLDLEVFTNREIPDEVKMIAENSPTMGSLNTGSMASTVLTDAENSTRLYSAFFGKLPYKRVAMTQQPAGFFGQAWPTLVFMPYIAFFDATYRVQLFGLQGATDGFWTEVAPHEVAHQWWGHSVGWTSYHDQWMSEGFAEFSASLFLQFTEKNTAKYLTFWDNQRKRILEATPRTMNKKPYTVGPVTQGYRLNSAKTGAVAQSMIYPKGAYILQMIRMMMYDHRGATGDQHFQEAMRDLISSHLNKDISTNDFKLAIERHILPTMDVDKNGKMDWFFDEYVYGTDMPSYKLSYTLAPGEGGKTNFSAKLEQSGVSKDFVMRVPLYLDFGKGWVYLGTATAVGNTVVDIQPIALPAAPKGATVAAFADLLAAKIEVSKQ